MKRIAMVVTIMLLAGCTSSSNLSDDPLSVIGAEIGNALMHGLFF